MKKRFLCGILSLVLATGVLSGCGSENREKKKIMDIIIFSGQSNNSWYKERKNKFNALLY